VAVSGPFSVSSASGLDSGTTDLAKHAMWVNELPFHTALSFITSYLPGAVLPLPVPFFFLTVVACQCLWTWECPSSASQILSLSRHLAPHHVSWKPIPGITSTEFLLYLSRRMLIGYALLSFSSMLFQACFSRFQNVEVFVWTLPAAAIFPICQSLGSQRRCRVRTFAESQATVLPYFQFELRCSAGTTALACLS